MSAQRALEDAGLLLGWALASVVNLLDPSVIIVGDRMALESCCSSRTAPACAATPSTRSHRPPIVASGLGQQTRTLGAVLLAAEQTVLVTG